MRRGFLRPRLLWFCFALAVSSPFCALSASAQEVAEAARQEKTRKAAQLKKQRHVYTNDDLKRAQILTPEDRAAVEARKKDPFLLPSRPPAQSLDAANGSPSESLAETARRYRREKALREAERALQTQPSLPFRVDLPQPLASPTPLPVRPVPAPAPSGLGKPAGGAAPARRDPFLRPPLSPPLKHAIPSAPRVTVAPLSTSPVLPAPPSRSLPGAPAGKPAVVALQSEAVTIQPGDSLWKLARRHLGSGARWPEWLAVNPALSDPNRIMPGRTLFVPQSVASSQPRMPAKTVVRSGDSLWKIAKSQFGRGFYWPCIARANPDLQDADHLYPGQTLLIPATCALAP